MSVRLCRCGRINVTCVALLLAWVTNASDGVWTNGAGLWTDTTKWQDGILPGVGESASFDGTGGTVTVPAGSPFSLSALFFNTNGANVAWTLEGETNELAGTAEILVHTHTASVRSVLTGAAGLLKTGNGTLELVSDNAFTGVLTIQGGRVCANSDLSLGAVPAGYQADAVMLNGGSLGNFDAPLTLHADRGVTAGVFGAYLFGRNAGSVLDVASPVMGTGPVLINRQSAPVVLSNPSNDYAGDTVVGAYGPGSFILADSATLRLGANEVIPHGAGKGGLVIDGDKKGVLDLNGKTETVNTLTSIGDLTLANRASQLGVLRAGFYNDDLGFSGEIQSGVVFEKIGTGSLFFYDNGNSHGGVTVSGGDFVFSRASVLGSLTVTLDGGALRMTNAQPGLVESVGKLPGGEYWINLAVPTTETSIRLTTRMANGVATGFADYTQYQYSGQWHVPASGTYSFAKSFDNGAYLAIDGLALINNSEQTDLIVTQNVWIAEGWHTVDLRVCQGSSLYGTRNGFASAILYSPSNSAFDTAGEISAAMRFDDPGDGSVLRTLPIDSGTNTVHARLELATSATFDRSGTAASLVWAGDVVSATNAVGTPKLTVLGGTEGFRVGTTNRFSVFGVDVDDANGVSFQDKVWLLSVPASSSWLIAPGSDVAAGSSGILGTGAMTLTNFSVRIPATDALGTGGETVTVAGTGNTLWFDATREQDSRLVDDPDYAFTASNNVVFNGTGAQVGFDGAGTVTYTGTVSGNGSLVKRGSGDTELAAVNTFVGGVQVNAGRLLVSDDEQLGDSANAVTLAGGYLGSASADPLTLTRTIQATAGGLTVPPAGDMTLSGAVSGTVAKQGEGTLTLSGATSNDSLDLAVDEGVAVLGKSGAASVRHIIRVATNASARLSGSGGNQIGGNVTLTGGLLDLNGLSETIGKLSSTAISSLVTNGGASAATLTVGDGGVAGTFLGMLADGAGDATLRLIKTGTNVFSLAGASGSQTATGGLHVEGGTLSLGAGLRYVRITPRETRTAGSTPALGEFQLLRDGQPLAWPNGTTVAATSSASTNLPARLIDNNSRFCWQASSASASITITLPLPILFNGYRWYTGFDSAYDPVAWTVEASADNSAWFTVDTRTNQVSVDIPRRGVLAGSFPLNGMAWPNDAVSPANEIDVAAGAVLQARLLQEAFAALTGSGDILLSDGASLRVEDSSAFTGTFTGAGHLLLGNSAPLDVPSIMNTVMVVNDGVIPASVMVGANGEPVFAGSLTDGLAPFDLVKRGSGMTRLIDAGSAYTGDTRVEQGTLAVQPNVWTFRYIRFNPTWTLNNNVPNTGFVLCISDFQLMRNGQMFAYPAGTTASTPYANHASGGAGLAINGSTTDRWLSTVIPNPLTIDTKNGVTFDGYRWYTSGVNSADGGRAPTAWAVEGSDDGVTWVTLDSQSGVPIPAFVQGAGQLVGTFSAQSARNSLPQEFWAETNSAALKLAGVTARYLRFTPTAARIEDDYVGWNNSGFQLSELQLMSDGEPVNYPAGTSATAPGGSYLNSYPPSRAVDNILVAPGNRWYSDVMINPLTVDMKQPVSFDAYRWITAENTTARDPISWTLEISNNTTNWYTVDVRTNQAIPEARWAVAGTWALDLPAGQLATDAIPDGSRTRVATGTSLLLANGAIETVGPLSGTGTVTLASGAELGINAFEDAVFEGDMTGTGTVTVAGDGAQTFRGGALSFIGEIILDSGMLELDGASLSGVTNIVLSDASVIAGDASVAGDLTVSFQGGAYRANLAVSGALSVSGDVTYSLPQDVALPYFGTLFTFGSTTEQTRTALVAGRESLSVPEGYVANVRVTANTATLSVSAPGAILMLQ